MTIRIFVDSADDGNFATDITDRATNLSFRSSIDPAVRLQTENQGHIELASLHGAPPILHRQIRIARDDKWHALYTGFVQAIEDNNLILRGMTSYFGVNVPATMATGNVNNVLKALLSQSAGYLPTAEKNRARVGKARVGRTGVYPSIPENLEFQQSEQNIGLFQAGLRGVQDLGFQLRQLLFYERGWLFNRRNGALDFRAREHEQPPHTPQTIHRREYQDYEMKDWATGGQFILEQAIWSERQNIIAIDKTFKIPPGTTEAVEQAISNGMPILVFGIVSATIHPPNPSNMTAMARADGTNIRILFSNPGKEDDIARVTITIDGQAYQGQQGQQASLGRTGQPIREQLPGGDLQTLQEAVEYHRSFLSHPAGRHPHKLYFATDRPDEIQISDILQTENPESPEETAIYFVSGLAMDTDGGRATQTIELYPIP